MGYSQSGHWFTVPWPWGESGGLPFPLQNISMSILVDHALYYANPIPPVQLYALKKKSPCIPLFPVSFYCGLFVGPLPKLTYLVLVWFSTNEFVCFGTGFLVPCIWAKIKIWIESKFFGYIFYVQFCFVLVWLQTCSEDSILNLIASFS